MAKKVAKKKVAKKTASKKSSPSQATPKAGAHHTQDIWLAGLGAFSLAQDEGGKILKEGAKAIEGTGRRVVGEGAKLFDRLIREGTKVQSVGRKMAEEAVGEVREDVSGRVTKVRQGAQANWDRLEKVFEERVAKALARLGVPTSDEIEALSAHVAKLSEQVSKLGQGKANATSAKKKTVAKKKVAKKVASKPAVEQSTPKQS